MDEFVARAAVLSCHAANSALVRPQDDIAGNIYEYEFWKYGRRGQLPNLFLGILPPPPSVEYVI